MGPAGTVGRGGPPGPPGTADRAALLRRHGACLLDPRHHHSSGDGGVRLATAYRPDTLLLGAGFTRLRARFDALVADLLPDVEPSISGARLELRPRRPGATGPDAWRLLRDVQARDAELAAALTLNHLLSVPEQPGGNPLAVDHGRPGLDRYAQSFPGRGPVTLPAPRPRRAGGRRPRVVVLDTGIGRHPWFLADPAVTEVELPGGRRIGPQLDPGPVRPADGAGDVPQPLLGTLGTHAGHGTFVAGLLRQVCPDAEIVALALMGADGLVAEDVLTGAVADLADLQEAVPGWADALVLSLGYYSESRHDRAYTSALKGHLLRLARAGVAVFCAAGNDATRAESFPAALADDPEFAEPDVVPLAAVAALTAGGRVAAFSNDGPWVNAEERGVGLVSTAPVGMAGAARPAVRARGVRGRPRSSGDADDFGSGWASWSGTSFAAPVLAARYLNRLLDAGSPGSAPARRALVPLGRTVRRTSGPAGARISAADDASDRVPDH
ncbi:S8 family serine peptidase [Nakamurella endophytica]|uniref:S8 family serine peptidase n=1 Tax=Nakamurella endophytica TaxID=1748367 RepID=UPI001E3625C6|nr:S8 family serine peptidase [Nakamurella endophytica]